jgi:methyl-accepting chemotaxis protein
MTRRSRGRVTPKPRAKPPAGARSDALAFARVVDAVAGASTRTDVLAAVCHTLREAFGLTYATRWTVDGEVLRLEAESGAAPPALQEANRAPQRSGEGVLGRAWQARQLVHVVTAREAKVCARAGAAARARLRACALLPIVSEDRVVAIVELFATRPAALTPARLALLPSVTRLASAALTRVRASERVANAKLEEEVAQRALLEVQRLVNLAADGKLEERAHAERFEGIYRLVCDSINKMLDAVAGPLHEVSIGLDHLARGELTHEVSGEFHNRFGALKDSINRTVASLRDLATDIRAHASSIAWAAAEISMGTRELAHRTEQQASSLQETASTMEQMTATVRQNADSARQANQLAMSSREIAERAGGVVRKAVAAMHDLNGASSRIGEIVNVIDEIAFQTNLLALNAAVEAARAGEQGRGFAVVATEVRNLAQRSATSAKDIKALIKDSVQKVQDGSVLVEHSGRTLDEIVTAVKKVADIVADIAAASQEQSTGIEQVNQAIAQMDHFTQQNATLVDQAAASASAMAERAADLRKLVDQFKVGDDDRDALPLAPVRPLSAPGRPSLLAQTGAVPRRPAREAPRPAPSPTREALRPPPSPAPTPAAEPAIGDDVLDELGIGKVSAS